MFNIMSDYHDEFGFDFADVIQKQCPFARFKGSSGGSTSSQPTLSPEQREALAAVNRFVLPQIGTGATPYPYPLVAQTPGVLGDAYSRYLSQMQGLPTGDINAALDSLISASPSYQFDPAQVRNRWQNQFADPLMANWRQTVQPIVAEGYNLPGVAHSTMKAQGVGRAASEFYGGTVAPTLFTALQEGEKMGVGAKESAMSRVMEAIKMRTMLPQFDFASAAGVSSIMKAEEQQILDALKSEFLRTAPEADPWTQLAMGYMTVPTMETVAKQGYSPWGDIASTAMAAAMLFGD